MLKRSVVEDSSHTERWVISYADFITLLFAFFVVMYAISSVNISKYRILSATLDSAFQEQPKSLEPIQVGQIAQSPNDFTGYSEMSRGIPDEKADRPLSDVAHMVEQKMAADIYRDEVRVRVFDDKIEIELDNDLLFKTGSAELEQHGRYLIEEVGQSLSDYENAIIIEGFTDNIPIDSLFYPSNWELSSTRSSTVARAFIRTGVAPERIMVVGYAEHQPIASNETKEGRELNRRVVIVVSENKNVRDLSRPLDVITMEAIGDEADPNFIGPRLIKPTDTSDTTDPSKARNLQKSDESANNQTLEAVPTADGRFRFVFTEEKPSHEESGQEAEVFEEYFP